MKIGLLTQSFLPKIGGQELVVDQLARQFHARGHEVTVLAQHSGLFSRPKPLAVPYRVAWYRKPRSHYWAGPVLRRALTRLLRDWPCDVVQCHKAFPAGTAALAVTRKLGVPLVVTPHETFNALLTPNPTRRAQQDKTKLAALLANTSAVTAMNVFLRERLIALCPECAVHITVIPNGVDFDHFSRKIDDSTPLARQFGDLKRRYYLFLGRLVSGKGAQVLIEAARRLAASDFAVQVIIAGDGPLRGELEQQAQQTGVAERIHFVGTVQGDDKIWLLQNAFGLVLPTRNELFGLVILEAMACGTPVISSAVGGVTELIHSGENGLFAAVHDPQSFADHMRELATAGEPLERMRACARAAAAAYAWPAVAQRYLDLFATLVRQKPS